MIALLLALVLVYLLYRTGTIRARVQLALTFVLALLLIPFLLQIIALHFGLIGFWSFIFAVGIVAVFAFSRNNPGKNDA